MKMKITPTPTPGDSKQGTIKNITPEEISGILGFPPNVDDDPEKVNFSWGFLVNGVRCGIWDYYESYKEGEFRFFGPKKIFIALFGEDRVS